MSTPTPPPALRHATMPRFVAWIQDHILLTLLIVASGLVNGTMLIDGIVPNIQDPHTWGMWGTLEVVALFAAGVGTGGLALRVSYKMSECYSARQWGRVIFLAVGMIGLAFIEFWASFSQRADHIKPTPADNAVLAFVNIHNPAVSMTAMLISIVVPFTSIFWGFAAEDPAPKPVEDTAELLKRLANEEEIAKHKTKMAVIRTKGVRAVGRAAVGAKEEIEEAPAEEETEDAGDDQGEGDGLADAPVKAKKLPPRMIDKEGLVAWVASTLNREITEDQALEIIKGIKGAYQFSGSHGRPWVANKVAATAAAKKLFQLRIVRPVAKGKKNSDKSQNGDEAATL